MMKPPRSSSPSVALVAANLDILGGQGVEAAVLIDALARDGCRVSFVPINPPISWMRRVRYLRTVLTQCRYWPSLARLRQVDVVHVFSASYWSFLLAPVPAMLVARAFGKRVVLHYHSGEAEDHLANWGLLVHPWLRLAHEIVVPSEYLRGVFARHGYQTRVIPNVIDLSRFHYRERKSTGRRFLSVRNLEALYRVDLVIEAFAIVRKRCPEATLAIAGTGSEEKRLRDRVARLGLGDVVRFLGRVPPSEMPVLYDSADVFVNASVIDNQPLSILEAFAAGLPVVSTSTGDIGAMVRPGETGWLVDSPQADAIANTLLKAVENPDQSVEMARSARREISRYTWPAVRQTWTDVYTGRPPQQVAFLT